MTTISARKAADPFLRTSGIASSDTGLWMSQIARNLTDVMDGFFAAKQYLIHDRDPLYTKDFLGLLGSCSIEIH
jgi:hypothetical protein